MKTFDFVVLSFSFSHASMTVWIFIQHHICISFSCELQWFFWYVSNQLKTPFATNWSHLHTYKVCSQYGRYMCLDFPCFQRELYLVWFRLFLFAVELILLENYFQDEKPKKLWFAWSNLLKEEGHYFPQLSDRVRDPKEFQLYIFQKL